jgi:hypothetical protein
VKCSGPRLLILVATVALTACSTTFTPATNPRRYVGEGGTRHLVSGVEVWTSGAPDRPFEVIGWLEDERRTGLLSRTTFESDVATAAKGVGGDGVILMDSSTRLRGFVGGTTAGGYEYVHAVGDRTSHLAVFKYVADPGASK